MRKFQAALIACVASAALATTGHAQADDGNTHGYGSVGYQTGDFGDLGKGLGALSLSGDLGVWKFISVEGDLGVGMGDKTTDFLGTTAKAKLQNDMAVYGVGTWPVSKDVDLFARVGFLKAEVKASAPGFSGDQQYSGAAVGVGVHYFPGGGKNGVALEYNHSDFGNNGHADVGQVSFVHRF
jgi:outer membrane immunogenic protein